MALSKYDDFLAPNLDRGEFSYTVGGVPYPDKDQVNIFGPLYLPRVYGKDLTSFEIASSGSIAVTLNDIHSFDLTRDNTNSNIVLQTYSNDSFFINVGNSNMWLAMDAPTSNVTLFSSNDVTIKALDVLSLQGDTVELVIGQNFDLNAKNINLTADSNVHIAGTNGEILFSASNSNITLALAENNAVLYALNDFSATASNDIVLTAKSNVYITAVENDMVLSTHAGAMSINMDGATDVMTITADGSVLVNSQSNVNISALTSVELSAAGGLAGVTLDSATSNIDIFTSKDISITADSNVNVSAANSVLLTAAGGLAGVTLDSASSNISIFTTKDVSVSASNDVLVSAANSVALSAAGGLAGITIDSTSSNISVFTTKDVSISASNDVLVSAANSVSLSAAGGLAGLTIDSSTSNIDMFTTKNITIDAQAALTLQSVNQATVKAGDTISMASSNSFLVTASNTISMEAQTSSLNLSANGGQVYASFDAPTNSLYIGTASNTTITSSNDVLVDASRDATLTADRDLYLVGLSNVYLKRDVNNMLSINNDGTINMLSGGNSTLSVYPDRVNVAGNFEVSGVINMVDITQSNLLIQDSRLVVAYDSNLGSLPDGPTTNDGAGLYVAGQDGGAGSNSARSIAWHYGSAGINVLGTDAGLETESYWKVSGGALRIALSNETKDIQFSWRIGQNDELELVKKVGSGSWRRIARLGRTLL